ncbi:MAG: GNAT family N-acetyltransferase [Candidatus Hydrogenedentes bacterium]|nr:GNAT family N-acetyltransferase [Candidatus Hydrogenedentota bacterium]
MSVTTIRRIRGGDALRLQTFYNGLSETSKRTFHPLSQETTVEVCEDLVRDNRPASEDKLDLLGVHEEEIVGWGFLHNLKSGDPVLGLAVADAWQGRGLGSALLDALMAAARERRVPAVTLTVVRDNDVARAMYERRGFVVADAFVGDDGLAYYRMVTKRET